MAVDRTAVLSRVLSMQQVVTRVTWQDRFFAVLFTVFASLALALAAGGLYAVIAYTVSMRTQEIGIRMALGASASQVRSWVMKQGIALTIIGLVVGVCAASAATRLLKSQLYQVSPMDATTYVSVVGVMLLVALAAAYLPARRATRVDPMIALRQE
jgi:putative ABC transport system permease protein